MHRGIARMGRRVIAGLDPAISMRVPRHCQLCRDDRDKPGHDEETKALVVMSKKRASKSAKRKDSDDKLSPKEWQARHDAACAVVARKYCDMFKFWRDCRYKPCRSARRCRGDQGACLESRCWSVPHAAGLAAHKQMIADTPADADRFARMAHYYTHTALCLHDP